MLNITKVLVDYEEQQIGITHVPQFSWAIKSDRRNVVQTSYQLQIALDTAFENVVYDSGVVEGDQAAQVEPEGFEMKSQTRYYVRVQVTAAGETAEWKSNTFVTGLMSNEEWKASFVTAEEDADYNNSKGTYVRKAFKLNH